MTLITTSAPCGFKLRAAARMRHRGATPIRAQCDAGYSDVSGDPLHCRLSGDEVKCCPWPSGGSHRLIVNLGSIRHWGRSCIEICANTPRTGCRRTTFIRASHARSRHCWYAINGENFRRPQLSQANAWTAALMTMHIGLSTSRQPRIAFAM